MKQYKFANTYLKLPDVGKDLYASTDYFPRGVKDAQQLVSQENYYARVIERTYYVYRDLNIIDTDITEEKVRGFAKKHMPTFDMLADEFIKKIKNFEKQIEIHDVYV